MRVLKEVGSKHMKDVSNDNGNVHISAMFVQLPNVNVSLVRGSQVATGGDGRGSRGRMRRAHCCFSQVQGQREL